MAYDWATPGVKCICVDAEDCGGGLTRHAVYTIRDQIIEDGLFHGQFRVEPALRLVEVTRQFDWGWHIDRFRPLITPGSRETVAQLARLTVPVREDA